jgi:hypothetical protein
VIAVMVTTEMSGVVSQYSMACALTTT